MNENKDMCLDDFTFKHNIYTRFRDIDAFLHVNNAVFLSYFEDARKTFIDRWKVNLSDKSLIVASIKIDYKKQLKHPSEVNIGQRVSRIGKTSFDILSVMFFEGSEISRATTTIVCYNFKSNKSIPVYKEIKNDFNK